MSAPTATAVFAHQPRALPRPARGHKLAPSPREIDCLSCLIVLRGQRLGYLRHSALMESPSPTHAELAAAMSCDESTARKHVHALARKGWIKVIPRTPRGILVQPFGPLPSERVRRG